MAGNLSDSSIRQLWRDPKFSGSFSGLSNFSNALHLEKNINIPRAKLLQIMKEDEDFLLETKVHRKNIPRRQMKVHGIGILWQADLAQMFEFDNKIGFLLCMDVFSRAIFCSVLKNKSAKEVQKAFIEIFKEAGLKPEKLETDQVKIGRNKASFAEYGIHLVKTRLFRLLRALRKRNWPYYLKDIVNAINNSSNSAIGGLKPADLKAPTDGPKIDAAIGIAEDIPFQTQIQNQKEYEGKKENIQKNDFVFVDFGPSEMAKGYDSPNYQIFRIRQVDAGKDPVLFSIEDQQGAKIPGHFYREQLTKTAPPLPGKSYRVEKIVEEKIENNQQLALVKFLHYPNKFNKWLPLQNFVDDDE